MAQRIYATAADYYDFIGADDPGEDDKELNALLRRASTQIDGYLRGARYDVDDDGMPLDPDVDDAITAATCAQVEWWQQTGDPTGADANAGATKILSVSLGTSSAANAQRTAREARASAEAIDILRNAGLLGSRVGHY